MKDSAFLTFNDGRVHCKKCGCDTNSVHNTYCHHCGSFLQYEAEISEMIEACAFVRNVSLDIGEPKIENGLCRGYCMNETNDETHDICKYCRIYFGKITIS